MVTKSHFQMALGLGSPSADPGSIWVDTYSGKMYMHDGQKWTQIEARLHPNGCLLLGSKVPVEVMRLAALDTA